VLSWFENCTYDELLHGEVTVEITEWDGESLLATITGPAPSFYVLTHNVRSGR
jgi:hypothetical protein